MILYVEGAKSEKRIKINERWNAKSERANIRIAFRVVHSYRNWIYYRYNMGFHWQCCDLQLQGDLRYCSGSGLSPEVYRARPIKGELQLNQDGRVISRYAARTDIFYENYVPGRGW